MSNVSTLGSMEVLPQRATGEAGITVSPGHQSAFIPLGDPLRLFR